MAQQAPVPNVMGVAAAPGASVGKIASIGGITNSLIGSLLAEKVDDDPVAVAAAAAEETRPVAPITVEAEDPEAEAYGVERRKRILELLQQLG